MQLAPKYKLAIIFGTVIILIIAIIPSVYFYIQFKNTEKLLTSSSSVLQNQTKSILEKVGDIIELPQGEEPTIVTITDLDKVKDQPFFTKAKNGDYVIVYHTAKKAILYDPKTNKILEVAPVTFPSPTDANTDSNTLPPSSSASASPTRPPETSPKILYKSP